jgi:hypothetical protein
MEENENIYIWNINNMVLRIISREHNFDFHHRTGEIWRSSARCPGRPGASKSCCRNNFSFEELDVYSGISNISNLIWMQRINNYFSFIGNNWGYGPEGIGNDTESLVSEKTNFTFELLQILVN